MAYRMFNAIKYKTLLLGMLALVLITTDALADRRHENHFASVFLGSRKIGTVHYTITYKPSGELEEIRSRATYTMLGIRLYDFDQHLHEFWADGELQKMWGNSNDNGKKSEVTLKRTEKEYDATLNGKPLVLPHRAFPVSFWHYGMSQHTLLFDLKDFQLMKVQVTEHDVTLDHHGKKIPTKRFDFTGDWRGKVWFDEDKVFLRVEYESEGRTVTIVMD